jgi:hypothetical protein
MLHKIKFIRPGQSNSARRIELIFLLIASIVIFASFVRTAYAQNLNGCDNYSPTTGQTVTCNNSFSSSTSGVQTLQNNTGNNNVTVNIAPNAQRSINGSTVGLGSNSVVNNAGSLNTQSFYFGYGISFGANGRSTAGGGIIDNSGSITTGGTNAAGIYVNSSAGSASSTITNSGTISTTGGSNIQRPQGASAIYATTGGVLNISNTNTGRITASGFGQNGITIDGPTTIINSGVISSINGGGISLNNSFNAIRSTITNQAGGSISTSSPATTAIQSLSSGVDISNFGNISSPAVAIQFANIATAVSNSLTLYAGSTTSGSLVFNPNSNGETLTFSGLNNNSFGNTITGLNIINVVGGANVAMNSLNGYSFANGSINVDGSSTLNIIGAITDGSGQSSIGKIGSGSLTLSGVNSYTGATTVNGGTIKGGAANAFSANSVTTINPTGTVDLGGVAQTINALSLAGGTLTNGALTGAITSTGGTVNSITGSASLTNISGLTTLTGANGYTGATTVNGGTVTVATGASLGSPALISSGATFNNNGVMSGTVDNACGGTVNNTGSMSNNVTNAGALTNTGSISGSLTNNTPCGVVNNTGVLSGAVVNNAALNNNTGGEISGVVTNNATGMITNSGLINNTLTNAGTVSNSGTLSGSVNNSAGGTLTNTAQGAISGALTNNSTGTVTNSGRMTNTVDNRGTFTNNVDGRIDGDVTNAQGGGFTNNGSIAANVTNNGTFTNASGAGVGGTFLNGATGSLENRGTVIGAVTNNGTGVNFGTFSSTLSNTGTLNNSGLISGAVTNTGTFGNTGTLSSSLTNSGQATNAAGGVINGAVNNTAATARFDNKGRIEGPVNNAVAGAQFDNSGRINGAIENAGVFSNAGMIANSVTNNGSVTNAASGTISGPVTNNSSGTITNAGLINNTLTNTGALTNRGTISGAVNNNAAGTITNAAAGTIAGALVNSGNVQNQAGAVISGVVTNNVGAVIDNYSAINNTVANFGILNLNGTPTVTGAVSGSGVVNVNGTFTQQATIGANQVNVNSGGTLNMTDSIVANTTVFENSNLNVLGSNTITGNLVNSGTVNPRDSATNLSIDGVYSQTARANFITHIDGLATGSYSQIISNQPISIASGSIITAALNPALRLSPGDTVQNVIQGNGPVAQQGTINVNTVSDRYKLDYRYDGQNVDLFLPGNSGGILQKYGERGTYYGALTEKTLWSLSAIEGPTTNALHQRYAVLNAVMSYDCNRFDKYNFCISAQARATGFGSQATGAGVFNIAYRPTSQTRIGAFLDYQVTGGTPSVDGLPVASTLSSGSVKYGYNNPTFGGYLGFSQSGYSGNPINTGVQAFVSGGYNPGKLSITRAMIVDSNLPFVDAQPGSGSASLNAYFVRGMLGYGISLADNLTLMPYVGLRYTDVTRGGYMESFNLLVTQPLVYNSYYERLVTGFGGGMLNGRINDKLGMMLGLGAETDFSRSANSFSGYSPIQLQANNLPFGFGHGGNWNGLRPTGMGGAYYDFAPNQRLMLNGFAGEQAWSSRGYLTGLAGYQVAF